MQKPLVVLHLLLSLSLSFSLLLSLSSDQKEASLMLYQALVIIYNTLIEPLAILQSSSLTDYNLSLFLPFVTFVLKELTLVITRIQPDLSISVNILKALESVVFKLPLAGLQGNSEQIAEFGEKSKSIVQLGRLCRSVEVPRRDELVGGALDSDQASRTTMQPSLPCF